MMRTKVTNPLVGASPPEIQLAQSPLIRVLCAVAFSPIFRIADETGAGIASFQDRIRDLYPRVSREQQLGFQVDVQADGQVVSAKQASSIWRFLDVTEGWRLSLSQDNISLETQTSYVSRDDFLDRLRKIWTVFREELHPAECSRLGVRYVNALDATDPATVAQAATSGLRSLSDTDVADGIEQTMHQAVFNVQEGVLAARWGLLPPNVVHDPSIIFPHPKRRWYLDLDCFAESAQPFDVDKLLLQTRGHAERNYAFFRWAMSDEFFERAKV
jgi:uncharacterized protein (TIGR04255 family)